MLAGWLRTTRRSPPQVSIHPIYPSTLYPSISSHHHGGGRREIIGRLRAPAAAKGRRGQITTESEIERWRQTGRDIREEKGSDKRLQTQRGGERRRGEADDTRSLNHRHIPHRTGASSSDRTPCSSLLLLQSLPSSFFFFPENPHPRGRRKCAQRTNNSAARREHACAL